GLGALGNFLGSSPGSACRTNGATFNSVAMLTDDSIAGTSHQYQILPSTSFSGSKNPRSLSCARTTAVNSTGDVFSDRLPTSRKSSETTPRSTRTTTPSSLVKGVMISQPGLPSKAASLCLSDR